nr:MAG TPA: hypothetical protein [Bacteriophage sp.]
MSLVLLIGSFDNRLIRFWAMSRNRVYSLRISLSGQDSRAYGVYSSASYLRVALALAAPTAMLLTFLSLQNHQIPVKGISFNTKIPKQGIGPFGAKKLCVFFNHSAVYNSHCQALDGVVTLQQYGLVNAFHGDLLTNKATAPSAVATVKLNQVQGQDLAFLGANQHRLDLDGLGPCVGGAQQRKHTFERLVNPDRHTRIRLAVIRDKDDTRGNHLALRCIFLADLHAFDGHMHQGQHFIDVLFKLVHGVAGCVVKRNCCRAVSKVHVSVTYTGVHHIGDHHGAIVFGLGHSFGHNTKLLSFWPCHHQYRVGGPGRRPGGPFRLISDGIHDTRMQPHHGPGQHPGTGYLR